MKLLLCSFLKGEKEKNGWGVQMADWFLVAFFFFLCNFLVNQGLIFIFKNLFNFYIHKALSFFMSGNYYFFLYNMHTAIF